MPVIAAGQRQIRQLSIMIAAIAGSIVDLHLRVASGLGSHRLVAEHLVSPSAGCDPVARRTHRGESTVKRFFSLACMVGMFAPAPILRADPLPTRVLTCSATRIKTISARLMDGSTGKPDESSGSAVTFENGGSQVSYDVVPAIHAKSRRGDHLLVCLVFIPSHCPQGDDRGRIYTTTNLRTLDSWTLPATEHSCGGA